MMRDKIWRYVLVLLLGWWLGGLTFYAVVVVRVGTELLGGTQQGFLTQQVTISLNLLGVLVIGVVLLIDVLLTRRAAPAAAWLVMALSQATLFLLHARLGFMLDGPSQTVLDDLAFYRWHQAYLWVTAVQWLAGLVQLWLIVTRPWVGEKA